MQAMPNPGTTPSIQLVDVAAAERGVFLDTYARYWTELEGFQTLPEPFVREDYQRFMASEPEGVRFAWILRQGERVGFCVYSLPPHWYRPGVTEGYVDEIFVEPAARGGGIARAVGEAMVKDCRARGAKDIRLQVLPKNLRAQAVWRQVGFEYELLAMRLPAERSGGPAVRRAMFAEVLEEHLGAIQRRDLEAYGRTLAEDVLMVLPGGRLCSGRDAVIEFHRNWFGESGWTWTATSRQVRESATSGTAMLNVTYRDEDGESRLVVTLTFIDRGDGFRLVLDQNTAERR